MRKQCCLWAVRAVEDQSRRNGLATRRCSSCPCRNSRRLLEAARPRPAFPVSVPCLPHVCPMSAPCLSHVCPMSVPCLPAATLTAQTSRVSMGVIGCAGPVVGIGHTHSGVAAHTHYCPCPVRSFYGCVWDAGGTGVGWQRPWLGPLPVA
jgi:hypothetical protein